MSRPTTRPRLKRELPAYQQVGDLLKLAITAGRFPLGASLPTVRTLARQYGTSISTIQSALESLAGVGLIDRVQGRGTVVCRTVPRLDSVGVYLGRDFLHRPERAYSRALCRLLSDALEAKKIHCRFLVDARLDHERGEPLADLVKAVSKREFQGLILSDVDSVELSWLSGLGIPFAAHAEMSRSRVNFDFDQMVKAGLEDLKSQGCHSIGAILPVPRSLSEPAERGDSSVMIRSFHDWAAKLHLTTCNSWIKIPGKRLLPWEHEPFGFEQFREIWGQPKRPDGLLVFPDTVARGCLTAVLESRVSVPKDLKLVFHRNEGIPMLCPLPVSWLVRDLNALVAALITQLEWQIQGRHVEPVLLPHALEPVGFSQTSVEKDPEMRQSQRKKK